ncbi:MAG: AsmA-like C-terminal domain-containing protein [Nitrospirota bacterium]
MTWFGGGVTVRFRPVLLGFLAALLAAAAVVALFFYNPDSLKDLLLPQVEAQIGRKIEVGEARFAIFPRIHLDLSDVVVRDVDPSRPFFKAKRLDLVLRSTPLMRLRVVVKRLLIDQPEITLRRDETGRWNFMAPPTSGPGGAQPATSPFGLAMAVQETSITNGALTLHDEFRPDGIRSLHLRTIDVHMTTGSREALAQVRFSGTLPSEHGTSSLSLSGKLRQAKTPMRIEQADGPPASPSVQFEGAVEALNLDIRQMADLFGPRPVPAQLHGAANLRGSLTVTPGVAGYDLVLSEMRAELAHLAIAGQGGISGLMTQHPTFSATVASSPVDLDRLFEWFPAQWLGPKLPEILERQRIGGIVQIVQATVTGTSVPDPQISMSGEFRVQEGRARIGKDAAPVQHLNATVLVEPGRVRIADITGEYDRIAVRRGSATVTLADAAPWLELAIGGDMAAADLIPTLTGSVGSSGLGKTLAGLRDIQGRTEIAFQLAGPLSEEGELAFTGGEFAPQHVSFRSADLPEPVTGLTGRIRYSPKRVEFDDVKARIGKGQVEVRGAIALQGAATFQSFTVQAKAEPALIVRLFPAASKALSSLHGTIVGSAILSGPTAAPSFKGAIDLKEASWNLPGTVQKPAGTPASIEFEAALSRKRELAVNRLDFLFPPVRLTSNGKIRLGSKFAINAAFLSGPIAVDALPAGLSLGGLEAGILEVALDVKGRGTNWKNWQYHGWVAVTNGRIAAKGLDAPLSNLYLRLKLLRNGADVKMLSFTMKDSDVRLSGTIRDWNKVPTYALQLNSSQFDLDLLIPKGERSPVRDALEELAATSRLAADISIERGLYRTLALTNLSWRLAIQEGTLDVDRISGQSEGSQISGRLLVHLPKRRPAEASVWLKTTDLPYAKVLELLGDQDRQVSGTLTLAAQVTGSGKDPKGPAHSLNGKIDLSLRQGRILRGTVIPKIIKILNLPALLQGKVDLTNDGLSFEAVTGTLTIQNGQFATQNLVMDSPVVKMSAAGNYDLPTDRLDGVVVVSPLGSYSNLVESIPLFGKLFAGERRGILTALFEVKGPLKDPEVKYLPLQSLTTGLTGVAHLAFDVLKNTLLLPKNLLAPDEEGAAAPQAGPKDGDQASPPTNQ